MDPDLGHLKDPDIRHRMYYREHSSFVGWPCGLLGVRTKDRQTVTCTLFVTANHRIQTLPIYTEEATNRGTRSDFSLRNAAKETAAEFALPSKAARICSWRSLVGPESRFEVGLEPLVLGLRVSVLLRPGMGVILSGAVASFVGREGLWAMSPCTELEGARPDTAAIDSVNDLPCIVRGLRQIGCCSATAVILFTLVGLTTQALPGEGRGEVVVRDLGLLCGDFGVIDAALIGLLWKLCSPDWP